jgi:hypothetical protein
MKRHVLPNAVALVAGLAVGLVVDSAVAAGSATLVFAWLLAALVGQPGRNGY